MHQTSATIVAYARVSSDEQRRNESIQTQVEALRAHAKAHAITVSDWYLDDGVKGALELHERPEGQRLLQDAQAGRVGRVLVYRVDRLGRGDDPRVTLNAVYDLRDRGARVVSITEPFDASEPSGAFMLSMLAGASSYERASILQRSRDGTNRLARQGTWLGGIVPYGYRVQGSKREARLVADEGEAEAVRLIYRLTVEEGRTCCQIADTLNALGVPTAYANGHGKRKAGLAGIWRAGRVRNLIVSPTYMGVHHYGKRSTRPRETIRREVPALVDPETWERAQSVLRSHQLFPPGAPRRAYLLRGLIRCGVCGLTFSGTATARQDGSHSVYYVCNGRNSTRGIYGALGQRCPGPRVRGDLLEEAVWASILAWAERQDLGSVAGEGERSQAVSAYLAEATTVERLAAGKSGERDAMLDLYRRGKITGAEVERQLDKIAAEAATLAERATDLRRRATDARAEAEALSQAGDIVARVKATLPGADWPTKRMLCELLVEGITVEATGEQRVVYRYGPPLVVERV